MVSACEWTGAAGFGRDRDDEDDQFGSGAPREDAGPSKADMSDDWGKDRKFVSGGDRGGGGFSGRSYEPSRADESSSWGRSRSSTRDDDQGPRASSRGSGFDDRGADYGPSKADTEDRWGSKSFVPSGRPSDPPSRGDSGTWGSRRSSSPPPSSAGRPRLSLKPRTIPNPDLPLPKSTASSESGTSATDPESFSLPVAPQTKRSNPFGAARPREEVLKEQGRDHNKEEAAPTVEGTDRCAPRAVSN